jgi:hypothetical protein
VTGYTYVRATVTVGEAEAAVWAGPGVAAAGLACVGVVAEAVLSRSAVTAWRVMLVPIYRCAGRDPSRKDLQTT